MEKSGKETPSSPSLEKKSKKAKKTLVWDICVFVLNSCQYAICDPALGLPFPAFLPGCQQQLMGLPSL